MRARSFLLAAVAAGLVVASYATDLWMAWRIALLATAVLFAGLAARWCSHRHATLLPPVHDAGPDRDHARWYCDRCGHTWAASFQSGTRPRVIFRGYDQTKAVRAAARADTLERQRRRLATQRAGFDRPRHEPITQELRPGPRPIEAIPHPRFRGTQ